MNRITTITALAVAGLALGTAPAAADTEPATKTITWVKPADPAKDWPQTVFAGEGPDRRCQTDVYRYATPEDIAAVDALDDDGVLTLDASTGWAPEDAGLWVRYDNHACTGTPEPEPTPTPTPEPTTPPVAEPEPEVTPEPEPEPEPEPTPEPEPQPETDTPAPEVTTPTPAPAPETAPTPAAATPQPRATAATGRTELAETGLFSLPLALGSGALVLGGAGLRRLAVRSTR